MKKLFIIIGNGAEFEETFLKKIVNKLNLSNYSIEKNYHDDHRALETILALLEAEEMKDYDNYFVLYSGINFHCFRDKLPCANINASLYIRKLTNVVGGDETKKKQELVFNLFLGGITQIIKK